MKKMLLFTTCLGLGLSLSSTMLVTNMIKNIIGRLRPDFLQRCNPIIESISVTKMICTGNSRLVTEGRKSFPSGHTSLSFASLGYISMFLAGQLQIFDGQGYVFKFVIVFTPLILAMVIGLSRIADYRHHWEDGTYYHFNFSVIWSQFGTCFSIYML